MQKKLRNYVHLNTTTVLLLSKLQLPTHVPVSQKVNNRLALMRISVLVFVNGNNTAVEAVRSLRGRVVDELMRLLRLARGLSSRSLHHPASSDAARRHHYNAVGPHISLTALYTLAYTVPVLRTAWQIKTGAFPERVRGCQTRSQPSDNGGGLLSLDFGPF